ncbi:MAG TPA: hypothetical protein VGO30_06610 [Mycobacterium sp.]|jgi:hypothetical protein|nr:hypothetical protein [Mycobacterium sp.]
MPAKVRRDPDDTGSNDTGSNDTGSNGIVDALRHQLAADTAKPCAKVARLIGNIPREGGRL